MPGYYGVKLGRHWNGLKIEIWELQDLYSNTVNLVLKGEIIFTLKIIKTHRGGHCPLVSCLLSVSIHVTIQADRKMPCHQKGTTKRPHIARNLLQCRVL